MGEMADYALEEMLDHMLYYSHFVTRNSTEVREEWYAARYKEERKMRGLTLKQVQRRMKREMGT